MRIVSAAARADFCLIGVLSLTQAGFAQAQAVACRNIDDAPRNLAGRSLEIFQGASPQALAAFRALNLNLPRPRIVNGHPTLISDNPWQIAIIRSVEGEPYRSQFCGGSLIRDNWVLTAAHCVQNSIVREDAARVDVVVGTSQYAIGGQRIKVAAIHKHPGYNDLTKDNDFALLRLQTAASVGAAIPTAEASTTVPDGTRLCVTGWGATFEGGPGAIDLLGATVPVVATPVCNATDSYNGDVHATMMCAGDKAGGTDSCQGDSGGPATAAINGRTTLVGVVSWGEGCARRLKYGIYAKVSTAAAWIATAIGGQ
ncbi:MAG: serine protease [Pseudolabrys sp.]|jgi:transmembrane serine protease 11D